MLRWVLRAMMGVVLCSVVVACDQNAEEIVDNVAESAVAGGKSSSAKQQSALPAQADADGGNSADREDQRDDESVQQATNGNSADAARAAQRAAPEFEVPKKALELDLTLPSELRNIDVPYSQADEPLMLPDLFNTSKPVKQKPKISGELILNDVAPEQPLTDRLGGAKLDVQVPIR